MACLPISGSRAGLRGVIDAWIRSGTAVTALRGRRSRADLDQAFRKSIAFPLGDGGGASCSPELSGLRSGVETIFVRKGAGGMIEDGIWER